MLRIRAREVADLPPLLPPHQVSCAINDLIAERPRTPRQLNDFAHCERFAGRKKT
mgnify:CR=1 FL=1